MSRKLLLPLIATAALGVTAPVAGAAKGSALGKLAGRIGMLEANAERNNDINAGQTAAINTNGDRITDSQNAIGSLQAQVKAIIEAATTQIQPALVALKDGLTKLSTAVQGPGIAGQLGAAGSKLPGKSDTSNTATPDALPAGTVYRQIVLATASYPGGAVPAGTPIGARTWVKLAPPGTAAPLDNAYSCVGSGVARQIGIPDGAVTCTAANISTTNP